MNIRPIKQVLRCPLGLEPPWPVIADYTYKITKLIKAYVLEMKIIQFVDQPFFRYNITKRRFLGILK